MQFLMYMQAYADIDMYVHTHVCIHMYVFCIFLLRFSVENQFSRTKPNCAHTYIFFALFLLTTYIHKSFLNMLNILHHTKESLT